MSFSFGAPPNTSIGGAGFGAGSTNPAPSFGFGNTAPTFGSSTMASNTTATLPSFGASSGTAFGGTGGTTGFGGSTSTGFNFGGTSAAAPTLGSGTGTSTFGVAGSSAFGGTGSTGFGGTGTSGTTGFGTGTAGFGGSMTSAPPPAFGSNTSTFGSSGGSFTLNAPTSTASTSLGFGAPTSQPNLGLSFGNPPTSTNTGFSFNAPTTSATSTFGLGTGFSSAPQPTQASTFGTLSTSTGTGFGLGGTTTLGVASLGKPTLSLTPVSVPTATTSASTTFNLGGTELVATIPGTGFHPASGVEKTTDKSIKESVIPPEVVQQFEQFKEFVKTQKSLSQEFSYANPKPFVQVQEDTTWAIKALDKMKRKMQKDTNSLRQLRTDFDKTLKEAEMIHYTYNAPASVISEETPVDSFFLEFVKNLIKTCQSHSKEVEYLYNVVHENHLKPVLSQEVILRGMKQQIDILRALAVKLDKNHDKINEVKKKCLGLRHEFMNDDTDIFENVEPSITYSTAFKNNILAGPAIFSSVPHSNVTNMSSMGISNTNTLLNSAFPTQTGLGISMLNPNPMVGGLGTQLSTDNRPFQLQQPPIGNKRGKR